jgi:hypothetical protein
MFTLNVRKQGNMKLRNIRLRKGLSGTNIPAYMPGASAKKKKVPYHWHQNEEQEPKSYKGKAICSASILLADHSNFRKTLNLVRSLNNACVE